MNKLLIASVALAAASLGGPVLAADMPLKAPPPPIAVYTWTGCYVGLSIGDEWGRTSTTFGPTNTVFFPTASPGATAVSNFSLSGFTGGAQAGCNYQVGNWVWGIEGDWSKMNKEGQAFELLAPAYSYKISESWLATARARLGYAVTDKWLWYVTGGGAWARVNASNFCTTLTATACAVIPPFGTGVNQSNNASGWTVGAGTEYALGYGWSIKSEFLYVQLSRSAFFSPATPVALAEYDTKMNNYIFRFGMNYKFGWVGKSPAVVARY
jgi:outer membrane immunogenic protein